MPDSGSTRFIVSTSSYPVLRNPTPMIVPDDVVKYLSSPFQSTLNRFRYVEKYRLSSEVEVPGLGVLRQFSGGRTVERVNSVTVTQGVSWAPGSNLPNRCEDDTCVGGGSGLGHLSVCPLPRLVTESVLAPPPASDCNFWDTRGSFLGFSTDSLLDRSRPLPSPT